MLEGPSLSVTLTTGTCAVVKNSTQGKDLSDLLEDSLTCIGPELSYTKVCALTCVIFLHAIAVPAQSCKHLCVLSVLMMLHVQLPACQLASLQSHPTEQ